MLQSVATLASLLIAAGMCAIITGVVVDDWHAILRALGIAPVPPLAARSAVAPIRRARLVRLSPQSAPQRAAA